MVRIKKFISFSVLLSLFIAPLLSAMQLDDMTEQGPKMEVESFLNLDLAGCTMLFDPAHVRAAGLSKNIKLGADKDGFFVKDGEEVTRVQKCDTDDAFKERTLNEVALYGITSHFKVSRFDTGEYKVTAADGLKGGGVAGATAGAYVGYVGTTVACHGVLWCISWVAGPAHTALFLGLSKGLSGPIHGVACLAGTAAGAAGAVATGPV